MLVEIIFRWLAVADPNFRVGYANLLFGNIFAEFEFELRARISSAPFGSATANHSQFRQDVIRFG